ncbi:DUF924 family protein [Sinorhizobium sp. BG8]|uniref:DUF924 family protein n=1 Tax=Sinorhizobium sp. BG8 TaxID=2613773 RepID=UPI00193D181C|nr:DUF924 family protein [Sinorhizobium sp. BG8]QRM55819.1 DUF924 domain-containing protein [Sinorhizobium sp. BG8]
MNVGPEAVVQFWFETIDPESWFEPTAELDEEVRVRFTHTHLVLSRCVTKQWRETAESRLAAILVLDQFPRNMYRGSPLAFSTDWMAVREAKLALEAGADETTDPLRRPFFYMPFEHSESLEDQDRSAALFEALGDPVHLDYARRHREVIRSFGRFPHRNAMLGRESTVADKRYLDLPGAGF